MKIKITIAYDGSNYAGWQVQPNGMTIQEKIEEALARIFSKRIKVIGAGRTDAGVHAKGQVAHFTIDKMPENLLRSLNALLPDDISILNLEEVDEDFHARFSAKEKCYTYTITTNQVQSPFEISYALHYTYPLSFDAMYDAVPHLLGKHDFSAFANDAKVFQGKKDPVKTLKEIKIETTESGFTLRFKGDGFLYKMVRNLTGLLLDIGRGKRGADEAKMILENRDRKLSAPAAPAHGLTLTSIKY